MDYRELEKVKEALVMMERGDKRKAARILLDLIEAHDERRCSRCGVFSQTSVEWCIDCDPKMQGDS